MSCILGVPEYIFHIQVCNEVSELHVNLDLFGDLRTSHY